MESAGAEWAGAAVGRERCPLAAFVGWARVLELPAHIRPSEVQRVGGVDAEAHLSVAPLGAIAIAFACPALVLDKPPVLDSTQVFSDHRQLDVAAREDKGIAAGEVLGVRRLVGAYTRAQAILVSDAESIVLRVAPVRHGASSECGCNAQQLRPTEGFPASWDHCSRAKFVLELLHEALHDRLDHAELGQLSSSVAQHASPPVQRPKGAGWLGVSDDAPIRAYPAFATWSHLLSAFGGESGVHERLATGVAGSQRERPSKARAISEAEAHCVLDGVVISALGAARDAGENGLMAVHYQSVQSCAVARADGVLAVVASELLFELLQDECTT